MITEMKLNFVTFYLYTVNQV